MCVCVCVNIHAYFPLAMAGNRNQGLELKPHSMPRQLRVASRKAFAPLLLCLNLPPHEKRSFRA